MAMMETLINRAATSAAENSVDLRLIAREQRKLTIRARSLLTRGGDPAEVMGLPDIIDELAATVARVEQESVDSAQVADMTDEVAAVKAWQRQADTRGIAGILNPTAALAVWLEERRRKRAEHLAIYEARKSPRSLRTNAG
jgi:hypothetical protein